MNFFVEALRNLALTLLRGFKFHQAPLIPPLTPLLGKKYVIGHHSKGWIGCL